MEIKKALNLLTNQYFKSLKHLEHDYEKTSLYSERLKDFNEGYLKLMGAVLSGDINDIRAALHGSWFYICATFNEKERLNLELLGII